MDSSLNFVGVNARDVCGTRGPGASLGWAGPAFLLPWEQLQPRAADAGTQPRANISRNMPVWVMCLEFSRVESPGDGMCLVCVSASLRSKVCPLSPAQGFAGRAPAWLTRRELSV